MSTPRIGLIFNGVWSHYTFAKATKYRSLYELLYVHDLGEQDLDRFDALVIPFQSHHGAIARHRDRIYNFLRSGKKIFIEGDSSANWLDATWEDRPVNNYWWVKHPDRPPVSETDFRHPIYRNLSARHAFWHFHGVYTKVPEHATILQRSVDGEVVTWETTAYGGVLLASYRYRQENEYSRTRLSIPLTDI